MSILKVTNMTQSFGDKNIFNNVSFNLLRGEHIGLIGGNGEGKTTFMRLITKEILPEEGTIEWNSKVSVGYMDQNVKLDKNKSVRDYLRTAFKDLFELDKKLQKLYKSMEESNCKELDNILKKIGNIQQFLEENDFYSIDSKIDGIATGIGIKDLLYKKTEELSGGQRSKILLAELLLEQPDILLLDEPTNHLDEVNIEWLKSYLKDYKNAFIIISHDRVFINEVINVVYHLENKKLTRYPGNYDKFESLYEERKRLNQIAYINQQKEIEKLEEYIAKNKARASTTKMAASREKKLNKMERIEITKNSRRPKFKFLEGNKSGEVIFETNDLVIGYDKPLTKKLNLKMRRGEKIAIVGDNGIGKTTLLKSLIGIISPISGVVNLGVHQEIGYFEQEIKNNTGEVILEVWGDFPNLNRTEIRKMLARCGLCDEHINSNIDSLSGGEQAKVRLCKLMNKKSNILILDEPTNHLDQAAKDELKRAVKAYNGSVILVSHEKEFYEEVADKVWNCEDWTLKICGSTRKEY